ncbi:hypothetical protein [Tautonia plasticadhaerens]|uniref:Uncharacterized protein n=1 Tax=Tautonia plasticadhaerens TaxID=2527974 RepID=A0A518HBT4_9BACT|nr:hypothetical protein [Tautonia plasticadhaerens]QDV38311.1 hypothetical protein ElP_62630 [Tautonia plasticadhaerens]
MARLRIRYPLPGDPPGHWSGELRREDEVPELGQDIELTAGEGPRRGRVVAMLFKATLAIAGIDADIFVTGSGPDSPPPALFCRADDPQSPAP